jgi:hypothetical protein
VTVRQCVLYDVKLVSAVTLMWREARSVMVDTAQVRATLVAGKTWLVLASSACALRCAISAGAALPSSVRSPVLSISLLATAKGRQIPSDIMRQTPTPPGVLLIIKSVHPYLARSSVASSLGFSISTRLGGAVVDS